MKRNKENSLRAEIQSKRGATQCAAYLRISGAQIAQLVGGLRLVLSLLRPRVSDAMRQPAQLRAEQGYDKQQKINRPD